MEEYGLSDLDNLDDGKPCARKSCDHASWPIGRYIVVAALIFVVGMVLAAFVLRRPGVRWQRIGENRIFDVQTGEVKWAEPKD